MELILDKIRKSKNINILFSLHSAKQCFQKSRMISLEEIRNVIESGKLIEDYPYDDRGHTCLLGGITNTNRNIHIVCLPTENNVLIITAYVPTGKQWNDNLTNREDTWNV